ncbi:MAG: hypothetical protein RIG68_26565 [Imperialibacter sp.]|uniref:hypothetical protein n=1 Tax=Imperialibacter sp. TaxID=2038411 RepID=UPI0032EE5C80
MPFNLLKSYPELLEIVHLPAPQRIESLRGVFNRDFVNQVNLRFNGKLVKPIIKEGQIPMDTLFHHLTTKDNKDEKGRKLDGRSFEMARSQRLHWVKFHLDEQKADNVEVFSYEDRIDGKDVIRTYVYDVEQEYVIILEPYRNGVDYYLLTAYHLNEPGGKKQIQKKLKKKLQEIH